MPVVPEEDNNFYDPQPAEEPLTAPSSRSGSHNRRSSSMDSPARRRENDNRTTNRDLLLLMLKIVLIPVLLVGGFFALKAVVGLFDEPSEEEMQQSEARAALMDKAPSTEMESSPAAGTSKERVVTRDFLAERMTRWEKAERHLRAAGALELRGIYDDAIVRLKQALQFAPENREAQRQLLDLYMDSGNYTEAVPLCIRLLEQDSAQWDLKILLLRAFQEEGKTELCVFLSDRLLRQRPDDQTVLEVAAYSHAVEGGMDKALDLYKQILDKHPKNELALEGAGTIYQLQEEWMKAVPYYLKLLELDPQEKDYLALARSYSQLGDSGKAIIFLGQAYGLYGEAVISPWLLNPVFDPIRDTSDFRSFGEMVVGERRLAAIQEIRRRETEREIMQEDIDFDRLAPQKLDILKPRINQQYDLRQDSQR